MCAGLPWPVAMPVLRANLIDCLAFQFGVYVLKASKVAIACFQ